MPQHKVGTREEWQAARDELAQLENEQAERNTTIKEKRLASADPALRDLHAQVDLGRPRAGLQLARRPARGLRGYTKQPARLALLAETYDDGGFTGANIERPAFQRLLADIDAGKIDVVVVYKVDRLSRSLLDFAKRDGALRRRAASPSCP